MRGLRLWEVSIPYGTIKRIVTGPPCASRQRLQFLMVQLKAPWFVCHSGAGLVSIPYGTIKSSLRIQLPDMAVVSIPYGTIKRFCFFSIPLLFPVSIPYGTIKSIVPGRCAGNTPQFQFLMVQLKAGKDGCVIRDSEVSIPYGTIKSRGAFGAAQCTTRFNSLWYN